MKKIKIIAAIIAAVLVFSGVYVLYNNLIKDYEPGMLVEEETAIEDEANTSVKAPDFTVFDIDGNEVSLSDMAGKSVVINLWASWCPPCKAEMPDFETLYKKYGEEVQFMMINMTDGIQETVDLAVIHIDKSGYTFPVYFDTQSSAAIAYNAVSIPATYFVDKNGNLVTYAKGKISLKTIERGIEMIR